MFTGNKKHYLRASEQIPEKKSPTVFAIVKVLARNEEINNKSLTTKAFHFLAYIHVCDVFNSVP